jgi:hypothetical protein
VNQGSGFGVRREGKIAWKGGALTTAGQVRVVQFAAGGHEDTE